MSDITSPEQLIDTLLDTIIENEANQISLEDNYSAIKKLLMDYHPQKEKPYQIQTKVLTGETAGNVVLLLISSIVLWRKAHLVYLVDFLEIQQKRSIQLRLFIERK